MSASPVIVRPDADAVRGWLATDFRIAVAGIEQIEGGADRDAAVWQATTDQGIPVAVKWTRRQTRTGLRLAASLTAAGLDGVPPLAMTTEGRAWSRRAGGRLSVVPWVEGEDAATVGMDLGQWEAYGALLAAVHAHPFPTPTPTHRAGARSGIRRRRHRFRAGLAELDARADAAVAGTDADVLDLWRTARARVALLVAGSRLHDDAIDGAAGDVDDGALPQGVPCHGDPHLGNVVIGDSGRLHLIDWDEAVVAPRELDLHLVEFPVLFTPTTEGQRAAFRRGYGEVALDEGRLVRFACVRALEDLVSTALAAMDGPEDARLEELRVFRGILSPVGSASLVEPRLRRLLDRGTALGA